MEKVCNLVSWIFCWNWLVLVSAMHRIFLPRMCGGVNKGILLQSIYYLLKTTHLDDFWRVCWPVSEPTPFSLTVFYMTMSISKHPEPIHSLQGVVVHSGETGIRNHPGTQNPSIGYIPETRVLCTCRNWFKTSWTRLFFISYHIWLFFKVFSVSLVRSTLKNHQI